MVILLNIDKVALEKSENLEKKNIISHGNIFKGDLYKFATFQKV